MRTSRLCVASTAVIAINQYRCSGVEKLVRATSHHAARKKIQRASLISFTSSLQSEYIDFTLYLLIKCII